MTLPVPLAEYHERVEKCQESAESEGLDALLAISRSPDRSGHVRYLSNYYNPISYNPSTNISLGLGYSAVLISKDQNPVLVAGFPPEESAQEVAVSDVRVFPFMSNFAASISEVVKNRALEHSTIGIAGLDVLSAQAYVELVDRLPSARLKNANHIVEDQRMIKSENEIVLLGETGKLADIAVDSAIETCRDGKRECELAGRIAKELLDNKAERVFWIDVKSGPRLRYPITWPMASNRKMKKADLVFFDIGAADKNGYLLDVSRTFVIGKPNREQRELLALTYDMSREVIHACRPGVKANELITFAREYVRKETKSRNLRIKPDIESMSYAGHGLGFEIERPQLTTEHTEELKENMILSPEPGITVPDLGAAVFEENIVVTEKGGKLLTKNVHKIW